MHFEEILDQAIAMLQRRGRVTYRALKRQFNLDDAFLEDVDYAPPATLQDYGTEETFVEAIDDLALIGEKGARVRHRCIIDQCIEARRSKS